MSKVILLELNEVPYKVFVDSFKKRMYKRTKLADLKYTPTISRDSGELSPWITWPTLHRGVTNKVHKIEDINQNVNEIDSKYPTIMNRLSSEGYKVGVFASMHSGSVDQSDFDDYCFFVPEAFAKNENCKPETVNGLQKFNILMSRASARSINKKLLLDFKILIEFISSYLNHHYRFRGLFLSFLQLSRELISPWTNVRRRVLQSDILFDVFMDLLYKNKPDYCSFFTNHVASNMHRFWEATYPEDYKKISLRSSWNSRYKNEISFSMKSTSYYIDNLINYVNKNHDTQLWIASSMGQKASEEEFLPTRFFWEITDISKFINSICGKDLNIIPLPQMIPCYSFQSDEENIKYIHRKLKLLDTNADFKINSVTKTTLAFFIDTNNLDKIIFKINKNIIKVDGLNKKKVNENSGCSAYHVPTGILFRYGKNLKDFDKKYFDKNGYLPTDMLHDILYQQVTN